MIYTPKYDIPKSDFISKIKIEGLPDKDESYVLVHADGKKEIVPVTRENSNAIDLQLQKQVSSGIDFLPTLAEDIDATEYKIIKRALACCIPLSLAMAIANEFREVALATLGLTYVASVASIVQGYSALEKDREIDSELSSYDSILQRIPLAATYLEDSADSYKSLQGKTEEEQKERYTMFKEMAERGRLPVSLLELETEQGATKTEIGELRLDAICNGYKPQSQTGVARQYTRS